MPFGDGTGPLDWGQGTERAMGRGGRGRGMMSGNRQGSGPRGFCICPNCGNKSLSGRYSM